ncbi:GldL-related protein [Nemorincola caseinilytica]
MSNQNSKKKIGLNSIISFGASVVILGLMFKILHWKGGEIMIGLGLATEALLFAILGWAARESADDKKEEAANGANLNELLSSAVTPKVVEGLTKGFQQFTQTVQSVNSIVGSAGTATNFVKEIEVATGDVKKFRDNMTSVSTGFDAFNKSLQAVSQMSGISVTMMKEFETAGAGMKSFSKNIGDMNANFDQFNKTLSAINQMTAASQNMMKEFEAATNGIKAYNKNLSDLARIYQAQVEAFRKN